MDYSDVNYSSNQNYSEEKLNNFDDDDNNYDYYDDRWEDDADYNPRTLTDSDKDYENFQIKSETTLYDSLVEQISIFNLSPEEELIALYIVGNIDDDGYLRRDNNEIVLEINSIISKHNYEIQTKQYELGEKIKKDKKINPAEKYKLNLQSLEMLLDTVENYKDILENINTSNIKNSHNNAYKIFKHIMEEDVNKVIKMIQTLEPPGIASRNIQECLIAQLNAKDRLKESQKNALIILKDFFEDFSKKHFLQIQKKLGITEKQIKDAFEEIKKLNPKPGADTNNNQNNSIIPDFIVRYDDKLNDFTINLNDANIPTLKVSQVYEKILVKAKKKKKNYNKATRDWMKERYENAKFFIQAIKQRSVSMLMVMTAIVCRQREFFLNDVKKLKPMIYQNITDDTGLDISTVCRIVNDKYVQTSTGIYELKFFFSEAIISDCGEEIATTVIKDKLKEIITSEVKGKPYSDDKLAVLLKKEGYNVARRTVAKYRESLKIPIARLRKEL
jgi:RNA polymerase sigma-54 factor